VSKIKYKLAVDALTEKAKGSGNSRLGKAAVIFRE